MTRSSSLRCRGGKLAVSWCTQRRRPCLSRWALWCLSSSLWEWHRHDATFEQVSKQFHASTGISSGPDAFLFFIFSIALAIGNGAVQWFHAWYGWVRKFDIADIAKVRAPVIEHGEWIAEDLMVGIPDLDDLADILGGSVVCVCRR